MAKEVDAKGPAANVVDLRLLNLPGETLEEKITKATQLDPVVIFGKTHCPFCIEAKKTFDGLGVASTVYNVDTIVDGPKAHATLKVATGQKTVPYVFIGAKLIGGCDATKAAQSDGSLLRMLAALSIFPKTADQYSAVGSALLEGTPRAIKTLFHHPEVVDQRMVRFTGVWVTIISLLVAIFYKKVQAHWVMCGLMVDFVLRFTGGGNFSALGSLSAVCCAVMELFGSKPRWVAGQSKQFASLCGIMFSSLAFLFFMCSVHNEKLLNVGLALTCALTVAAALEGFLGFCAGCWVFSWAVKLGLLPPEVFQVYTNTRDEVAYTWEDLNKRLNEGEPSSHRRCLHPDGKTHTQIDYQYKAKTDDMVRESFNVLKYVKIGQFMMPLGIEGCACGWKLAYPQESLGTPMVVYQVLGVAAAALHVMLLVLYALKWIKYPKKVAKEWQHNVAGNMFVLPPIITVLLGCLVLGECDTLSRVLFWIGAPMTLGMSMCKVGDWFALRKDFKEHLNASWIMMPVCNAIAAQAGVRIHPEWRDACQFWFAFSFVMWALLFSATFLRTIVHIDEDDRYRPTLGVWIAAPAVLAIGYVRLFLGGNDTGYSSRRRVLLQDCVAGLAPPKPTHPIFTMPSHPPATAAAAAAGLAGNVTGSLATSTAASPDEMVSFLMTVGGTTNYFNDFVYITLHWFAVAIALVLAWCFVRPFLGRMRFEMPYWGAGFPVDTVAMTCITYAVLKPGPLSQGIAFTALAAASTVNAILLLQTLAALLRRRVFVAEPKWSPLSFLRLTHEALRFGMKDVLNLAEVAGSSSVVTSDTVSALERAWTSLANVYTEHCKQEDQVVFKLYEEFYPGVAASWSQDHRQQLSLMNEVSGLLAALKAAPGPTAAQALHAALCTAADRLEQNLRGEEDHLDGMPRKHINLTLQKEALRGVWALTPATTWFQTLPWVVNHLPMLHQRVRAIKTLLWAMPERAQQFGMMVGTGVDAVQWRRVTDELPEIIPRGAAGWYRYY